MATSFQGFRSLVENSPDAISLIDAHGEILYGSASNIKLFGYRPEELIGRNCLELIHPDDRDHSSRVLNEVAAAAPGPLQWDARVLHKNGNYSWIESTASNLLSETEVNAIVVHQRDINLRKAVEEDRQRNLVELARSNLRLEEFAYTAAHDLREPLRAIRVYAELLSSRLNMDPQASHMFDFIIDGAKRMSTVIDDLLSFASTGVHNPPQSADLEHAMTQAAKNLSVDIKASDADITVGRLPSVMGNEIHLVRLLQNLISNALKYRSERTIRVDVSAESRDGGWVISVADNGIGIAAEYQEQIFKPFVRLAKSDVAGAGLGLAVCRKIVEGMGGTIWVESEVGVGSTFRFTTPGQAPSQPS